jgi:hypothetical protein
VKRTDDPNTQTVSEELSGALGEFDMRGQQSRRHLPQSQFGRDCVKATIRSQRQKSSAASAASTQAIQENVALRTNLVCGSVAPGTHGHAPSCLAAHGRIVATMHFHREQSIAVAVLP